MKQVQKWIAKAGLVLVLALAFVGRPAAAQTIGFYEVSSPSTAQGPLIFGNSLPASVSFLIKNTGGSTASGVTVSVTGGNNLDFILTTAPSVTMYSVGFTNSGSLTSPSNNCGGSIAAGASCTATVTFSAPSQGTSGGVVSSSVQVSGSNFGTQTLAVVGWNPPNSGPSGGQASVYSDTSTGTVTNSLAILTTSNCPNSLPACATSPSTSVTAGAIGIVTAGAGKGTLNTIQWLGNITCVADNAVTTNDVLIFGTTTSVACKDSGYSSLTFPGSSSVQTFGIAQGSVSAGLTFTLLAGVTVQ